MRKKSEEVKNMIGMKRKFKNRKEHYVFLEVVLRCEAYEGGAFDHIVSTKRLSRIMGIEVELD